MRNCSNILGGNTSYICCHQIRLQKGSRYRYAVLIINECSEATAAAKRKSKLAEVCSFSDESGD